MHSNQSNNSDHRPVYLDIFNAKVEEIDKTKETRSSLKYPEMIVDLKSSRLRAIDAFKSIK